MKRNVRCTLCGKRLNDLAEIYLRKWEYEYCSKECHDVDKSLSVYDGLEEIELPVEFYDLEMVNAHVYTEPFDDMDEDLL